VSKLLRLTGLLVVTALAVWGATAVASSHRAGACPGKQTTISLWDFSGESELPYVPAFEKSHRCIKVKVTVRDYNTHHQALLTALASGSVPDVAGIEIFNVSKFLSNPSNFTNLYDLGARSIKKDYLPWMWQTASTPDGKKAMGVPVAAAGLAIAYRADYFKQAGLPTQRDAVARLWPSWKGFIAVGKKFTAKTGIPFVDSAGLVYDAVLGQAPSQYYDRSGKPIYATNPYVRNAWNVAVATIQNHLSAKLVQFTNEWTTGIGKGAFGSLTAPSWMQSVIKQAAPKDSGKWDIAPLPGIYGNIGGSWLTIPAKASHPKEAYEFISWILSPKLQLEVFKKAGALPATPGVYGSPAIQRAKAAYFGNAPIGKIYTRSLKGLHAAPLGRDQLAIENEFLAGIARMEEGKETAAEAWKSTLKRIKLQIGS
jgi:cellobiose transport system substrate-binding protein